MTTPKVSVIVAVYNTETYLTQCMNSIVNQTLRDLEIICVDDGSTDGSLAILNEFAKNDSRIRVFSQRNQGAGAARNFGLQNATGEYLSFLDSDDFFEPEMLEKAYSFAARSSADIVVFGSDQYNDIDGVFHDFVFMQKDAIPNFSPFNRKDIRGNVFRTFVGWAWDKLIRSDFIRENKLTFQEIRTSNDMRFTFLALVLAERIVVDPGIYAHHRLHNMTSLSNTREKSWNCFYLALSSLKQSLLSYGIYPELEQDYINYTLHASLWNLATIRGAKRKVLYNQLRHDWFQKFGIQGKPSSYFYEQDEYFQYSEIIRTPFSIWITRRRLSSLKWHLLNLLR